mgnify:CR=1 FL=1
MMKGDIKPTGPTGETSTEEGVTSKGIDCTYDLYKNLDDGLHYMIYAYL